MCRIPLLIVFAHSNNNSNSSHSYPLELLQVFEYLRFSFSCRLRFYGFFKLSI